MTNYDQRWMHAMHVDAFFEFCFGKPHNYYTHIPPMSDPHPEYGRDGVPVEEDLALRALHPESRPKRGRRKAEDKEHDSPNGNSPGKRTRLSEGPADLDGFPHSSLFPNSAIPSSAHPDGMDNFVDQLENWTPASALPHLNTSSGGQISTPHPTSSAGQHFKWRAFARGNETPSTPYPHSAITPSISHPPDSALNEPMSAVTPSTPSGRGKRRRHGPAVSSAWPSSGNPLTGKLRGRPPSNRTVRDGPFSTFPVNPKGKEGPVIDLGGSVTPISTPISGRNDSPRHFQFPPPNTSMSMNPPMRKPSGLHLQVPQTVTGNIRLATPTVIVNGESSLSASSSLSPKETQHTGTSFFDDAAGDGSVDFGPHDQSSQGRPVSPALPDSIEQLEQRLAERIRKSPPSGGISIGRAKAVAHKSLQQLRQQVDWSDEETFVRYSTTWLGHISNDQKSAKTFAIRTDTDSMINTSSNTEDNLSHQTAYDMSWKNEMGPLTAEYRLRITLDSSDYASPVEEYLDEPDDEWPDQESIWKKKYFELLKQSKVNV
jgi:ARS binding protein 2